jgi:hypothetical protein
MTLTLLSLKNAVELGTTLAITTSRRTLQKNTGNSVFLRSVRRFLVMANVVPSSPILISLNMEAIRSSETSVLTRGTWRNIPEDDIVRSHRRENLKSYITFVDQKINANAVTSVSWMLREAPKKRFHFGCWKPDPDIASPSSQAVHISTSRAFRSRHQPLMHT